MTDPFRKRIEQLLHERRPDRYTIRNSWEGANDVAPFPDVSALLDPDAAPEGAATAWLDKIAKEVADDVPELEARQLYASQIVRQMEGSATKRANALLRKIGQSGQLIIGWWGNEDDPVAVITRKVVDGKMRVKEERVALRSMYHRDFRDFALEERKRASKDFSARNDTCVGAELIADRMEAAGATTFRAWADEVAPRPKPSAPCEEDSEE
jgi:hypothetical protein